MEWSSEVTLEFLRLYEQESAIWNPKDPLHKNRTAVAEAWKRIEGSLSIKSSVKELKKKKESLMATFRPLLNKVKASMKTGNGADDMYKPNWFAFETMARFLHGIYQPRNTINTQELEDNMSIDSMEQNEVDEQECEYSRTEERTENVEDSEVTSRILPPNTDSTFKALADGGTTRKRKGLKMETIHSRMEEAYQILKNVSEKPDKDECSLYAELLAKKLRALDENTREIVMHEINNLMFHAKMRKRNPQSLQAPFSSHPGGLCSTTPAVETYNNHSFSFPQHNSHISVPNHSSQPSPGNSAYSPYSQPYSGNSSPAQSYYSQPSPGNASTSHITTAGNHVPTVSESDNPPAVAILGSTTFD